MENNYTFDATIMESAQFEGAQAPEEQPTDALSEALDAESEGNAVEAEQHAEDAPQEESSKALRGRMKHYEDRGYKRGKSEAESAWAEERKGYLERLEKYERKELEDEARELAQKNHMPEDMALEYLQMKKGMAVDKPAEQPRDASGKFAPASATAERDESEARATVLMAQADAFEKVTDGEVSRDAILEAFKEDSDVRRKVVSGEWDFTDVGRYLMKGGAEANVPRAVRSPNNGSIKPRSFQTMSDADFAKFNERVKNGAVFDVRR